MVQTPLKKGDVVVMHTCIEAERYNGQLWTCRTDEFKHHPNHDYTVVMLEGFSGSFATEYLQKVNLEENARLREALEKILDEEETNLEGYKTTVYEIAEKALGVSE